MCRYFTKNTQNLAGLNPVGFDEKSDRLLAQDEGELEETITYQRKKPGRKPLSKHIPREVVRYELPEAERVCDCGHPLHEAGEDKSEQLEIIPAQINRLYVKYSG